MIQVQEEPGTGPNVEAGGSMPGGVQSTRRPVGLELNEGRRNSRDKREVVEARLPRLVNHYKDLTFLLRKLRNHSKTLI